MNYRLRLTPVGPAVPGWRLGMGLVGFVFLLFTLGAASAQSGTDGGVIENFDNLGEIFFPGINRTENDGLAYGCPPGYTRYPADHCPAGVYETVDGYAYQCPAGDGRSHCHGKRSTVEDLMAWFIGRGNYPSAPRAPGGLIIDADY
jgi:hypothetical protein